MHVVYILYSVSADKFYIGQTNDLELRLTFHNELAEQSFTSKYRPWILKCSMEVNSRAAAMKIEKYIKNRKSKAYIQRLINDSNVRQKLLQRFSSLS